MDSLTTVGTRIDKKRFLDHRWITDLLFFEGPILSFHKGSKDQDYFYYWCENDSIVNRWWVIPVSREEIETYLEGSLSLYQITAGHFSHTFLDINREEAVASAYEVLRDDIPGKYVPPDSSYFDRTLCPSESYKYLIASMYVINIDKRWFFDEFSVVEKLFTQLYSFVYAVENVDRIVTSDTVQYAFAQYPWRGGFSAVNFYNDLRRSVPSLHEPEVKSIEYHSPGSIQLELLEPVAKSTGAILNSILNAGPSLKRDYDAAQAFLKQSGLLKIEGDPAAPVHLTTATISTIRHHFEILSDQMRMDGAAETIWSLSGNPLIAIKILLSFYRRAVKLNKFQENGKLRFPG